MQYSWADPRNPHEAISESDQHASSGITELEANLGFEQQVKPELD